MLRFAISILAAGLLTCLNLPALAVEAGDPAPDFRATDLAGHEVSLSSFRGRIVVLEWNNPGCPFVQKHYDSGNMQHLQKDFTDHGVVWLTINSTNPHHPDYLVAAAQSAWNADKKLASTDYLTDPEGKIGRLYGAKTTPHMFIIDKQGMLAYAGGIDDRRSTDLADVPVAHNFVSTALTEMLSGRAPSVSGHPPYGCSVKY
jgi:peroxiredoxin